MSGYQGQSSFSNLTAHINRIKHASESEALSLRRKLERL